MILERGITEIPQTTHAIKENKILLDEASRAIYKGLALISDFLGDVDQLADILS
jgi:hypothetical protein